MATLERPAIRPLQPYTVDHQGQVHVAFHDGLGVSDPGVVLPLDLFQHVVRHFDGQATLGDLQARVVRETGRLLTREHLERLVADLDRAMILDGPAFQTFRDSYRLEQRRPAALAGRSYPASERALRAELARHFHDPRGAGPPPDTGAPPASRLRAILSPHIDFGRGGPTYSWAYRALFEQCDAEVFVILGVAHQPTRRRFVLTYKDFETPLGLARTDRPFVERLAERGGPFLFEDELVHRAEHSIEFQVVYLQYLLGDRRDFAIVPVLVGSFHDLMVRGVEPARDPQVRRFIDALSATAADCGRRVAFVGGIDLGHVGPEFGDPDPVDPALQERLRAHDTALLDRALAGDPEGWFAQAAAVGNRYRVCGLAATYTLLHAIGPARGRLLRYDQAIDARRTCCVSFCSAAFETA